MSAYAKFYFRPGEGEQIETNVHLFPHRHSAILGSVTDSDNKAISGALVLLFEDADSTPSLLSQVCTDEDGQFMFGPLACDKLYMVKICKSSVNSRTLQVKTDTYEF